MKQGAAQACMKLFLGSCSLRTVSCETFNLSIGACHAAIRSGRITCFIIPPLLCIYRAAAADPQGLTTNFPVQIEDAFPINFGQISLQFDTRATNDPGGSQGPDLATARPVFKIGPLPGLQLDVGTSYNFGGGSGTNQGTT